MSELFFLDEDVGRIFSWAEVNRVHKVRIGIYQRGGRLVSLLTDMGKINPCYPDTHHPLADTITYTGNGRHGDQKLDPQNRALLAAIDSGITVPLFNKHAPGRWEFMGHYTVSDARYIFDERQQRSIWQFTLNKILTTV
jgi:hypothetical protein